MFMFHLQLVLGYGTLDNDVLFDREADLLTLARRVHRFGQRTRVRGGFKFEYNSSFVRASRGSYCGHQLVLITTVGGVIDG